MNISKVFIKQVNKNEELTEIFNKTLKNFDLDRLKSLNVVIKPNLCRAMDSKTGATTETYLVELLINELKKYDIEKISIIESDTYYRTADECFERMGYFELKNKYGIELVNISKGENFYVKIPYINEFILFPRILLECDFFIDFAKLKTYYPVHDISICLKNLWGCYPVKLKASRHPIIKEFVSGLVHLLKPDLCIVDGLIGMEGCGPIDGNPKIMNTIIFGNDAIAVDIVCAKLMGFNPIKIPMIKYILKNKLNEFRKIKTNLKLLNKLKSNFIISYLPLQIYFYRTGYKLQRIGKQLINFGNKVFFFNIYEYILEKIPQFLNKFVEKIKNILKSKILKDFEYSISD